MTEELQNLALEWWPVVLSVVFTFFTVGQVKRIFKDYSEFKRRLYTRLLALVVGFTLTFPAIYGFMDLSINKNLAISFFVGLGVLAAYKAFMVAFEFLAPEKFKRFSKILKHHE